jgi:beta-lactam-binding protein with PASTA domain
MRTCQSCGRENPPDRDFCECGEYLRWEATGFVEAVTPEMAAEAAPAVPAEPAAPPPPAAPAPVATGPAKTQVHAAAPPPAAAQPASEPEHEPATITLRLPDDDGTPGEMLAVGVHPGDRARVRALIRNQSGIVDNYQLSVLGLPDGWFSVLPDTVYLVPYGSGGTYEQEVEVHLHPPRTAEAEARIWELQVTAYSKAQERMAATAPLLLGIQPFEQHETKVKPERASGRRKADFNVAVRNKANAPVYVAFAAKEADDDCGFAFTPPTAEIAPGETVETRLRVRPPKQIWIGRPHERRLDVQTKTGEEAHALEAAATEEDNGHDGGELGGKLRGKGIPGVRGPKLYKPQVYKPNVHLGPGGVQVQKPMVRGPQMVGPQARGMNMNLNDLKMPGGQAPPAVTGPLLPTQAVFRQKPWLPWWVAIVVPLLALLALLLFLFLPKNVEVPKVVGKTSAFEAEKAITEAGLRLAPKTDEDVDGEEAPGTVLKQTPEAGATAEEKSEVKIVVAVGTGNKTVPNVVGKTPAQAEKTLREKGLSLGQATPQPVDPEATIKSQIPPPKEILKEGSPVDIFLDVEKAAAGGEKEKDGEGKGGGTPGGTPPGGEGSGGGGPVKVPAIDGATAEAYAQKVGDAGLLPQEVKAVHESDKGTVFRVDPEEGEEAEPGTPVKIFVSAGFPELAYDNSKDILLINAADGTKLDPIADGSQIEDDPTWSWDGSRVAFTSANQVFVKNVKKPDSAPVKLTEEGDHFTDLAWAPTVDVDALAMVKRTGGNDPTVAETQLCFGLIEGDEMTTGCKPASANFLGRKLNWSPNGKSLLAFAQAPDGSKLGMIRFRSDKPFSTDHTDWESEGFVTPVSKPGEGVLDAALDPDGRRWAVVLRDADGRGELYLAKPRDLLLSDAERLGVRACKVIWRPDGKQLLVVRADDCGSETGELIRLSASNPKDDQDSLGLSGDNPAFQPLAAE